MENPKEGAAIWAGTIMYRVEASGGTKENDLHKTEQVHAVPTSNSSKPTIGMTKYS